ncbi:MAG TPA: hypothetical protein VKX49_12455 [Bryobacteraceae bacterium]|nr:hypothetical protein [Bryobacteraceae bacterium]
MFFTLGLPGGDTLLVNTDRVAFIRILNDGSCRIWFSDQQNILIARDQAEKFLSEFTTRTQSVDVR